MKEYDIMVVGPVSLDHNIDYLGNERKEVGGAVVASGFAAAGSGAKTAIFCKSNAADADVKERFAGVNADLYWAASKATCSIRNQYFTADKEKRACTSMGVCDPFRFEELPQVKAKVYHFAGLVYGDFDGALLTTVLVLVAESFLSRLEYRILDHVPEINLYMEYTGKPCLEEVLRFLRENKVSLQDMEITRNSDSESHNACAIFSLRFSKGVSVDELLTHVSQIEGVITVQEL